jgi:hypothetical protein
VEAGLAGADWPGAPALLGEDLFGDGDLGGFAGLVGQALAAVVAPRGGVELQAAVVAVAGVGVPVAACLARGDLVPVAPRGRGVGRRGRGCGAGIRASGRGRRLAGDVCEAQCDEGCKGEGGGDGDTEQPVPWRTGSESGRQGFLLVQ